MLLVQYGYIFLVLIFLLLFSSPKGSENKETKISELGKYISYCTLSRAITITYPEKILRGCKKRQKLCEVVVTRPSLEHCHTPLATG